MKEISYGNAVESLDYLVTTLGTMLFSGTGVLVERAAFNELAAGATAIGLWETGMGALLLFVGLYLFGYRRLLIRLHQPLDLSA